MSKLTLRPYQQEAVDKALNEPTHGVLIASGLGSGKTVCATEIALRLGAKRVLIVAPRNTLPQWAERFSEQSDGVVKVRRLDSTKAGKAAYASFMAGEPGVFSATSQWLVAQDFEYRPAVDPGTSEPIYKINKKTGLITDERETERIHLKRFKWIAQIDVCILDEMHILQSRTSLSARTLNTLPLDWRIGMSATWHGNNASGAWSASRWVWPELVDRSYWRWVDEWLLTEEQYIGHSKPVRKVVGEKVPGAYAASLPCYIRDLPHPEAPAPIGVYVDISPRQRAQYEQLEMDMVAWAKSNTGEDEPIVADLPIVLRQRLRTATLGEMSVDEEGEIHFASDAQSAKLDALRGILEALDRREGGKVPAVIFTDSRRWVHMAAPRMQAAGYRTVAWTGDASEKQREEMKRKFMGGEVDYIVATIPALSEGLDGLQHRCSTVIWASYSEDQLKNQQSVARVWRPGVDAEKFQQIAILARGTLDDETYVRLSGTKKRSMDLMRAA